MTLTNSTTNPAASATNTLRDIRPPVEIPSGWSWLLWTSLALVVLGVAWWLWRRHLNPRPGLSQAPVIPPHLRARRRIEDALRFISDPREFCIRVSDALRAYLEERFDFRAPERTTEEFLRELQTTPILTDPQKTSLADFLQRCDLVKFARYEPAESELMELHDSALRLVGETEPSLATTSVDAPPPANTPSP